jgi:hypothetical protein
MRDRSVVHLVLLSLVLVGASSLPSSGAVLNKLAPPEVVGFTTNGGSVSVTVHNPAPVGQSCAIRVTTVSDGLLATTVATQWLAANSTASVSVPATGIAVNVSVSVGIVDSQSPGGDW